MRQLNNCTIIWGVFLLLCILSACSDAILDEAVDKKPDTTLNETEHTARIKEGKLPKDPVMLLPELVEVKASLQDELSNMEFSDDSSLEELEANLAKSEERVDSALEAIALAIEPPETHNGSPVPVPDITAPHPAASVPNESIVRLMELQDDFKFYKIVINTSQAQSNLQKATERRFGFSIMVAIVLSVSVAIILLAALIVGYIYFSRDKELTRVKSPKADEHWPDARKQEAENFPARVESTLKAQESVAPIPTPRKPDQKLLDLPSILITPIVQTRSPEEELIQLYNQCAASDLEEDRRAFRDKFAPILIGVLNSVQRTKFPNEPAKFGKSGEGDYLAVQFRRESNEFWFFLRFDLTINEVNFTSGAIGEVFDCEGHDPAQECRDHRLVRPAVFSVTGGDDWKLKRKGMLKLK